MQGVLTKNLKYGIIFFAKAKKNLLKGAIRMEKGKIVPTSIRLDEKLLNKVKELALKNKRSVTAQIEYMLEKYIEIQDKD